MGHDHHHTHAHHSGQLNRAFVAGIVLNLLFVVIEAGAGIYSNSLALLSDAGHNLSDVASLSMALLAFRLARVKTSETYTYGYQKTTILVALANAVILLIAIGSIGWQAIHREFGNDLQAYAEPVHSRVMIIVAAIGIVINSVTALLFFRDKEKDLNVKGAYLHLAADATISAGVVVSGIIILYTNWYWLDSVVSVLIMIVIFAGTWKLLKETVRLSLDGVPHHVNIEAVKQAAATIPGIKTIHHIHIWAMSTTSNALTAHVVVDAGSSLAETENIKQAFKQALHHLNIQHITLEVETFGVACADDHCE